MGAVSTTFMAGVELVRKGKAQPVGSLTQLGTVRLGKRTDGKSPLIKKFVSAGGLERPLFSAAGTYSKMTPIRRGKSGCAELPRTSRR